MQSLLILFSQLVDLVVWILIAQAILSWLVALNIVNTHNGFVYAIGNFLHKITNPLLKPIRQFLPDMGGIDISPVVLILLLYFIRNLVFEMSGSY
tara:strand:+ start:95 stop:379 length:285 start_codon:yes stop_codon:yes gene_type:complete